MDSVITDDSRKGMLLDAKVVISGFVDIFPTDKDVLVFKNALNEIDVSQGDLNM